MGRQVRPHFARLALTRPKPAVSGMPSILPRAVEELGEPADGALRRLADLGRARLLD